MYGNACNFRRAVFISRMKQLMGGKQLQSVFVLKIDDAVQPQDRNLAAQTVNNGFQIRHIAADK